MLVFACGGAIAQKDTGGLAGVVKDPSGAVVAGAKVRITDTERGTELVTTTNAQGEFVVTPLKIGRYQLTVEKTGFKKTVAGPIIVNVDSRPSVDIVLSVGSIQEVISVTDSRADAPGVSLRVLQHLEPCEPGIRAGGPDRRRTAAA